MKKSFRHLFLTMLLCLTGVGQAEAQRRLGPILDWIYKLSGPGIMQAGLTASLPVWTSPAVRVNPAVARVRFSGMLGSAIDKSEEVAPPGGSILVATGLVMMELDLAGGVVSTGMGVMAHAFFGDVDGFVKPAFIPARLMIRPFGKLRGLVVGASVYYYPKWGTDDFLPLTVEVSRDSGEWTWGPLLSYEVEF
jgi:hypothetical protein